MERAPPLRHGAASAARGPRGSPATDSISNGPLRLLGLCDQSAVAALEDLENLSGARQCGKVCAGAALLLLAEQDSNPAVVSQRSVSATAPVGLQSGPLV